MKYGAAYGRWAKMSDAGDTDNKPTYGDVTKFNGLNTSDESFNMADASAYGDNKEKIYISEFTNGTLDIQLVQREPEVVATMMGATIDDYGGLLYGSEDVQPIGAYGFIANKMYADKTKYYDVNFYPKVTAVPQGESNKTKEDQISLEYESLSLRVQSVDYANAYKIEKQFSTEAEALAYLDGLFAGTEDWPAATVAA